MGRRSTRWVVVIAFAGWAAPAALRAEEPRRLLTLDEEEYDTLMKKAREALAKQNLDEARASAEQALQKAGDPPEGGTRTANAHALIGDVEQKKKRPKTAAQAFKAAAHAAAGDASLRKRMLAKRRAAALEGQWTDEVERIDKIFGHDSTLDEARKRPWVGKEKRAETRVKLAQGASEYARDKDAARAELANAVRALVSVQSGAPEEGVPEAKAIAEKKGGKAARMVALEALWIGAGKTNDLEASARAALELNALRAEQMPQAQRRYARMKGLDQLCDKYDHEHKAGACARLERQVTGTYTLRDLSKDKPKKELSETDLDRAHAAFLPALEDCVLTQARSAPDTYSQTDIQISWAIQPQGTVSDVEIAPKRYKDDLTPCVSERLAWLRYPRYTSPERKSVTIPYHLD
jgi:hypothetical protein